MSVPQVPQGQAATLVAYPPEHLRGTVTAATVRIGTPNVTMPDNGTAATVSSLDTTTDAAANRGDRTISVASATGATAGRKILIGDHEAELESISGTTLTLRLPLPLDVATGTVVKGLDLSIALDSTDTDQAGNALAIWTVGTEDWTQPFVVAYRSVAYGLDAVGLRIRYPVIERLIPGRDADLSDAIEGAWLTEVEPHLLANEMKPENVISWSAIDDWHAAAVVYRAALNAPRLSPEAVDTWATNLSSARNRALDSRRFWYSETDDISGDQPDNPVGRSRLSFEF
jgi:hypothetical protein